MNKTQKLSNLSDRRDLIFIGIASLILLISFLIFTPKVASLLFPQKRQMVWNTFITHTLNNRKVDGREYWKFREFYSPGVFLFDKSGLSKQTLLQETSLKRLNQSLPTNGAILLFRSDRLTSIDYLTASPSLADFVPELSPQTKTLLQTPQTKIYQEGKTVFIVFLKSLQEMEKANGFLEYNGRDKSLVQGKHWINVTVVMLD